MSHIVVINNRNSGGGASRLRGIGDALRNLATIHSNNQIVFDNADDIKSITLPYRKSSNPGKVEVEAIAQGLAIADIQDTGGGWSRQPTIGPDDADSVEANLTVRFVFEGNNEVIIVVPSKETLDYGLFDGTVNPPGNEHSPPMNEGPYYPQLPEGRELLQDFLGRLIEDLGPGSATIDEIEAAGNTIIEALSPDLTGNTPGKEELFFQQLGAYSVRQCE